MERTSLARIFAGAKQFFTTGMFFYNELPAENVTFITINGEEISDFRSWLDFISSGGIKDFFLSKSEESFHLPSICVVTNDGKETVWECSSEEGKSAFKEIAKPCVRAPYDAECVPALLEMIRNCNDAVVEAACAYLDSEKKTLTADEKRTVEFLSASGIYTSKGVNSFFALILIADRLDILFLDSFEDAFIQVMNYYDVYNAMNTNVVYKFPVTMDHVQNAIYAWQNMTGLPKFNLPNFIIEEVLRAKNLFTYLEPSSFDEKENAGEPHIGRHNNQNCIYLMTSEECSKKLVNNDENLLQYITCLTPEDFKQLINLCQYHNNLGLMIDPALLSIQMPLENFHSYIYKDSSGTLIKYPDLSYAPSSEHPLGRLKHNTIDDVNAIPAMSAEDRAILEFQEKSKMPFWKRIFTS